MWRRLGVVGATVLLSMGCSGGEGDDDIESFQADGTITAQSGEVGDVAVRQAFGFATNGSGLIYMASNGAATCESVVEMLQADQAHNPDQVLLAGHCNLIFKFQYDESSGYDGLSFTADQIGSAFWSVSCAMDDGAWEFENRDGDRDYYYTGVWWQGSPDNHSTGVSVNGEDIAISTTMGPYSGHFIYQGLDDIAATGQVSGTIQAKRCTTLAQTVLFPF